MAETGHLSEKSVAEIFRAMAAERKSGILRVSRERAIKVVFFQDGNAVYGLSNQPDDQLDVLLVRQKLLTPDQTALAKSQISKEYELGQKLVDLGLLDEARVTTAMLDQSRNIVESVFQFDSGEYTLDLAARAAHPVTLQTTPGELTMAAARKTPVEAALGALGGREALFKAAEPPPLEGATVSPLEGFLMSRVTRPTSVAEICDGSGLPEDQALPSLYALAAGGYLDRVRDRSDDERKEARRAEQEGATLEELRVELNQTLTAFLESDYYEVLGLERDAEPEDLKRAYYGLAKRYHPDRHHYATEQDIRDKLDSVFATISKAYETLKDSHLRMDYDSRLGPAKPKRVVPPSQPKPAAPAAAKPKPVAPAPPPAARPKPLVQPLPRPAATGPQPMATPPRRDVQQPGPPSPQGSPSRTPLPSPSASKQAAPPQPSPARPPRAEKQKAAPPHPSPAARAPSQPPPTKEGAISGPAPRANAAAHAQPASQGPSAPLDPRQRAEELFVEGLRRFERKDLMGAIEVWRESTRLQPSNVEYHRTLGIALARNPRWFKESEKHLLEALKKETLNPGLYVTLGNLYASVGLKKRAEVQYRAVLVFDPHNAEARRGLASMGVTDLTGDKKREGDKKPFLSNFFKKKDK